MPASILAHQQQQLRFDAETNAFAEDKDGDWTIQSLDYFEAQRVFAIADPVESVRVTVELGLVSCPNGTAAEFLACPSAMIMQPLYLAIWAHTRGN